MGTISLTSSWARHKTKGLSGSVSFSEEGVSFAWHLKGRHWRELHFCVGARFAIGSSETPRQGINILILAATPMFEDKMKPLNPLRSRVFRISETHKKPQSTMIGSDAELLSIQIEMEMFHCLKDRVKLFLSNSVVASGLRLWLAKIGINSLLPVLQGHCRISYVVRAHIQGERLLRSGVRRMAPDDRTSFSLLNASWQFSVQMNFSLFSVSRWKSAALTENPFSATNFPSLARNDHVRSKTL